jgi:hypothetical protein
VQFGHAAVTDERDGEVSERRSQTPVSGPEMATQIRNVIGSRCGGYGKPKLLGSPAIS